MHYLGRLISITISYSLLVAFVGKAFTFFSRLYVSRLQRKTKEFHSIATPTIIPTEKIRPLSGFDYRLAEPIKYRPFKAKRHVTMGISKSVKEDWIRIDRGYLERMTTRKQLLDDTPEICMGNSALSNPAIRELYEEIVLDLLPKRFPAIFSIKRDVFYNCVTGFRHCISAALLHPPTMLRCLAENVEEDFWFMVPNEDGEFFLQGFAACFPQGLLPLSKVGLSVSQIHAPIPGYEGRLKKGVNRCFERMESGQSVGRLNWSIQCNHSVLHLPFDGANTIKAKDSASQNADFDPLSSFLRVEHHTLTCLPRTGTIVFAVRSYLTPLTEIRSEGSGHALADACDSMPEKFAVYKNRPTWGAKLGTWLRESDCSSEKEVTEQSLPTSKPACPFSAKADTDGTCPFAP